MELGEIRRHLSVRPFKPFIIHMDNGKTHIITHPEIIITETIVVAVDEDGDAVYLAPEAISAISRYKNPTKPGRLPARRTRTKKAS
ncbi:hypothetical protein L0337_09315 [candidate division KSB1 bacterium]|nr:hypothetical protein [candidate division KSB1 bacterium]